VVSWPRKLAADRSELSDHVLVSMSATAVWISAARDFLPRFTPLLAEAVALGQQFWQRHHIIYVADQPVEQFPVFRLTARRRRRIVSSGPMLMRREPRDHRHQRRSTSAGGR